MPHKINPLRSERLTGLARLVRSNVVASLETVALWGERDLSNSSVERVVIPQIFSLVHYMLAEVASVLNGLVVDAVAMSKNLSRAEPEYVTHLMALRLIEQGRTRHEAFASVQGVALDGVRSQDQSRLEGTGKPDLFSEETELLHPPDAHLGGIDSIFQRAGLQRDK